MCVHSDTLPLLTLGYTINSHTVCYQDVDLWTINSYNEPSHFQMIMTTNINPITLVWRYIER